MVNYENFNPVLYTKNTIYKKCKCPDLEKKEGNVTLNYIQLLSLNIKPDCPLVTNYHRTLAMEFI